MASRLTVFFLKDQDGYGWSEKYYWNGNVTSGTLPPDVSNLYNARLGMACTTVFLTHIRIASLTKRDPFIFPINDGAGAPGTIGDDQQPAEVALLTHYEGVSQGFNRNFIRGIPETVTSADHYTPTPAFTAAVANYRAALVDSGTFNVQGTLGSPSAQHSITSLVGVPPRGVVMTSTDDPGAVGDQIRVHGAKVPGYNGLKNIVQKTGAGPFITTLGGAAPPAAAITSGAYFTKIVRYDTQVADFFIEAVTRRAAGRPFGVSRGRQVTLYSLRQ